MCDPIIHQQLGELKGRLDAQEKRINSLEEDIDARLNHIEAKLDSILEGMAAARGGWKVVSVIGSIILVVAGAITWVYDHFSR